MAPTINKSDILLDDPRGRVTCVYLPTPPVKEEATAEAAIEDPSALADGPGIKLKTPIEFEGKKVRFISTDFSRLKGRDLKMAAKEYKMRFKPAPGESFLLDSNYLVLVFSRINQVDEAFFDLLDGNVYLQLTEFFKLGMQEVMASAGN